MRCIGFEYEDQRSTYPMNMSCGLAAPEVCFRMSGVSSVSYNKSELEKEVEEVERCVPSEKPKLSTTGIKDDTVKYVVPSFISSAIILPFRRATTP
jgi:hypothetical protein